MRADWYLIGDTPRLQWHPDKPHMSHCDEEIRQRVTVPLDDPTAPFSIYGIRIAASVSAPKKGNHIKNIAYQYHYLVLIDQKLAYCLRTSTSMPSASDGLSFNNPRLFNPTIVDRLFRNRSLKLSSFWRLQERSPALLFCISGFFGPELHRLSISCSSRLVSLQPLLLRLSPCNHAFQWKLCSSISALHLWLSAKCSAALFCSVLISLPLITIRWAQSCTVHPQTGIILAHHNAARMLGIHFK